MGGKVNTLYTHMHTHTLELQQADRFRDLMMLPMITEGEAQDNYQCIPKVSKQPRDLLECNNWLRLWVISFSFSVWGANFWWVVYWVLVTSLRSWCFDILILW